MKKSTKNIWREQSFAFIDEASGWLERDFYGDDVDGVLNDLDEIIRWAEEMREQAKD